MKGSIILMNRSAKDREWSSLHYGGEGILVPLYRTKVFADDTTRKIIDVTLGELLPFLTKRISNPIRKNRNGK
jgi:hypothetical protein